MKVKLVDRLVDGNKLSKEGERVFSQLKHNKLLINGKEETIVPIFAGLCQSLLSVLLGKGYVEYNEKEEYTLKRLCENFRDDLKIFEDFKPQEDTKEVKTGHGPAAALEVLPALGKKLDIPESAVTANELLTKPTEIPEETLKIIDKLLQELSQGMGSLRAAIVEVGDVPKNEKKDILENCRMTRFFAKTVKVEEPPAIEASTIITQCFNFHKTIVGMNRGIREDSSAKKKNPITKAILLTESKDTRITFMLNPEKPKYVFLLETTANEKIGPGIIFLEMKKTMEKVLKLL